MSVNIADDGSICGWASVYGVRDSHADVVERGAYTDTLKDWARKGKLPCMMLMHNMGPLTSDMLPIGRWTKMVDDPYGLWCEGQLSLGNSTARDIYALIKDKCLDGLSIGFSPVKFQMMPRNSDIKRKLISVKLHEVSVVTSPSNPESLITRVKSHDDEGARLKRALAELAAAVRS
ncbi:HK97 family phage prohead protease [Bradyrhizobium sp. CCBAU 51627]|uniref:HK97 family phage prohead protease n=1 Tax=Bradyrhizobium sp. CCBAU 51627 TaxID=1325088 RepID=UPI00230583A9|nr:HK97 family phage prohead protease [Bradyrhizobium sp. CCBAU 51627]